MRHFAVYLSVALVAPSALGHATEAGGPSFDCAKAATPIEQAICADSTLGDLDKTLAGLLKDLLARDPARREAILSEQRLWLAQRDQTCRSPAESLSACLAASYQTRIGQLRSLDQGADSTGVCKKIAGRYRARTKPAAECHDKKCFYAPSPLDALAGTPGSGVTKEKHAAELRINSDDFHELVDWASRTPHPFTLSKEVMLALNNEGNGSFAYIDHLPDSNLFAITWCDGMHCDGISNKYFTVEDGRARAAGGPKNWAGEGSEVDRWFGTVDGTPVAFQDDYRSDGPQITSNLSVAPWVEDRFGPFCTVEFKFAPRFSSRSTNEDWEESCSLGSCDALREVALKLVQEVQQNPRPRRNFMSNA
jgi:uncharacterized protein